MRVVICFTLLVYLSKTVFSLKIPSQKVHVVTPSSRAYSDEGRGAPFYYHNWRRRMDTPKNETATTTSTSTTLKTPDLIFAEFESGAGGDMRKSIRNLLEKERINQKTSTTVTYKSSTLQPIYVPDYDSMEVDHGELTKKQEVVNSAGVLTNDFDIYNDKYNNDKAPTYLPSTTTTTSSPPLSNVEDIWHIIDNEKRDQYSSNWKEVPIDMSNDETKLNEPKHEQYNQNDEKPKTESDVIDENFALPGFPTNPGNGAENESRAIRTDPNVHFPYVSLKPFQMKHVKNPVSNQFSNSKKGPNMYNSLDNFKEIHHPVRGEVQDINLMQQPIERYNPAQPYLPKEYGTKSKQSNPSNTPSIPSKVVANLVPPPPPPPPKVTDNDFPAPTSYESFPPYQIPSSNIASAPSPLAANPPMSMYPSDSPLDSPSFPLVNDDSNDGPGDISYQYKPPSLSFRPTLPPLSKPFSGYSYNTPAASVPQTNNEAGSSYNKPEMTMDAPPSMDMDEDAPPMIDDKPDFQGYHYSKPTSSESFDSHDSYHHNDEYPELIFNKPHGGSEPVKGGNDMKDDAAGMMPPPPPANMMPNMPSEPAMDDNGFPPGFPGDFKFHHDFDDHDFYHHHHHHPTTTTTTTTTTESPRVNRYSYYYLGKKLYYLPLYFSVYFIVYVGALIIKAVLRHKIVYPNSFRPNDTTASFFAKRSLDSWNMSSEYLHEITGRVTKAIGEAAEKYISETRKK
ncbi:hypothetical protein evm_013914 [Chilo suppressalis]|nr:hypothetical protein evm_013914 [Chilo suppressalis]